MEGSSFWKGLAHVWLQKHEEKRYFHAKSQNAIADYKNKGICLFFVILVMMTMLKTCILNRESSECSECLHQAGDVQCPPGDDEKDEGGADIDDNVDIDDNGDNVDNDDIVG